MRESIEFIINLICTTIESEKTPKESTKRKKNSDAKNAHTNRDHAGIIFIGNRSLEIA